uniref:Uncharacterized protein n=1 Tax=Anguilla anguilla TaxID=7936 RepID=A0A0E9XPD7_ANGAN
MHLQRGNGDENQVCSIKHGYNRIEAKCIHFTGIYSIMYSIKTGWEVHNDICFNF